MSKTRDARQLRDMGEVPIVGESVWMICPSGHLQHLRQPFAINIGAEKPLTICGVCWANFVQMFQARQIEGEELEAVRAELAAAAAEAVR